MKLPRLRPIAFGGLPVCVATVGILVAVALAGADKAPNSPAADLMHRISTAANPFPDVVARVNGQPVRGASLAKAIAIARENSPPADVSQDEELQAHALQSLIDQVLLSQAAVQQGLLPSDEEVAQEEGRLIAAFDTLPDGSPERQAAEEMLTLQGMSFDTLSTDPAFFEYVSRSLSLAKVKFTAEHPAGLPGDSTAARDRLNAYVDALRQAATIEVIVGYTPTPTPVEITPTPADITPIPAELPPTPAPTFTIAPSASMGVAG